MFLRPISMGRAWISPNRGTRLHMWSEWGRLTRFFESARIGLLRERRIWESVEISQPSATKLTMRDGPRRYSVTVSQHLAAIQDEHSLCSAVLVYSYALAEMAAREALGIPETHTLKGGIESWGQRLLKTTSASWAIVLDGKAGCVEVAILRNAVAHGRSKFDLGMRDRLANAGGTPRWNIGERLTLDYDITTTCRSRLKSLLRYGGIRLTG
jgi:hypothetical protein